MFDFGRDHEWLLTDPTRGLEPKTWKGQSVEVERFLEENELIELYKRMHRNKFPLRWQAAIWLITAMGNDKVLSGDKSLLVAGKEIASYKDTTLTFSGYELCQFDRKVYSTCLDYYRESPLPTEASSEHVRTSFYEFATRMGQTYGLNTHRAIRASLLRLSFAQMRMRYNRWNLEIPKLLAVSFEDGEASGEFKGSDILLLKVSVSLAELFGPGEWTAIDKRAVGYDGLLGWLSNFYAGHARGRWVDVAWLQRLSGYKSHIRNFKAGLVTALDKLKSEQVPEGCRVKDYHFSKDGEKLLVLRPGWTKPSETSV